MVKVFKSILHILGILTVSIIVLLGIFYIFPIGVTKIIIGLLILICVFYVWNKQDVQDKKIREEKENPSLGVVDTRKHELEKKVIAWIVFIITFFISMMAFTSSIATNGVVDSLVFALAVLGFLLYVILTLLFPSYDLNEITNKKGLPKFFIIVVLALFLEIPLFGVYIITGNPWLGVIALLAVGLGGFLWINIMRKRTVKLPFINPLPDYRRRIANAIVYRVDQE